MRVLESKYVMPTPPPLPEPVYRYTFELTGADRVELVRIIRYGASNIHLRSDVINTLANELLAMLGVSSL